MNDLLLLLPLAVLVGWVLTAFLLAGVRRRIGQLEHQREHLIRRVNALESALGRRTPDQPTADAEAEQPTAPRWTPPLIPQPPPPKPANPPKLATPNLGHQAPAESQPFPPTPITPSPLLAQTQSPAIPTAPAATPARGTVRGGATDWEDFMGARLFAWLGGFALFLGVAYFVKYSFERNLIPPSGRVLIGILTGFGLLLGGHRLRLGVYQVTSQSLCGAGVVILYAALFAGHAFYNLAWLPTSVTYAAMTVVTAAAFALSVKMNARVVSVLGMLGGFLTPVLLSKGQDQALALFLYVALLDVGLIAVGHMRRWDSLPLGAALGTVVMEFGWASRFFLPEKVWTAWVILAAFSVLFTAALAWAARRQTASTPWATTPILTAGHLLLFGGWLLGPGGFADRPGTAFAFIVVADLCLLATAFLWTRAAWAHVIAGWIVFAMLIAWMGLSMTPSLLYWGLGLSLAFALLHTAFPVLARRWQPAIAPQPWSAMFPALAVAGLLAPLMRLDSPSFAVWPTLVLLNLVAIAMATSGSLPGAAAALAALILSGLALSIWIGGLPSDSQSIVEPLLVVVAMAAILTGLGAGMLARTRAGRGGTTEAELQRIPIAAALMPFLLMTQLTLQLRIPHPATIFAALGLLAGILLALSAWLRLGALPFVGTLGAAIVAHSWWAREASNPAHPGLAVVCCVMLYALFAAFPLVMRRRLEGLRLPWVASALAAIPFFHVAYRIIDATWPNPVMGLVPLAFALPVAAVFAGEYRRPQPSEAGRLDRLDRLAWLGGVALFLATVALPIQLDHQWLTVGLALEGAALVALHRRVPHDGLRWTGIGLLGIVFVRLIGNPWVLDYAVRGEWPLWNWWLYTYGVTAACLFAAARWLNPPEFQVLGRSARALLTALGVILLFALLNAQIADFFTQPGNPVRFEFTGHFARDMTYTIAWALFALALVIAGLRYALPHSRWAGLGLLAVATAKLFLHDLARLDQLYRVGALLGVALVAIAASVLYQRFVAKRPGQPSQM